jgi:hypothetical protein
MTARLNQILAVLKAVKPQNIAKIDEIDKMLQKPELFNGMHRVYQKKNEDGDDLPAESKKVQRTVKDELRKAIALTTEYWNLTAVREWTNCVAKADVKLDDGTVILSGVPASYLLFLEKQLTDFRTLVARAPLLDASEDWTLDPNSGLHKSNEIKTHKTQKQPRVLRLTPTTVEHPGTSQVYMDDVLVGHWHTTRQSGAMRKPDQEWALGRIDQLLQAVKKAREEANGHQVVETPKIGELVFDFLMEGVI